MEFSFSKVISILIWRHLLKTRLEVQVYKRWKLYENSMQCNKCCWFQRLRVPVPIAYYCRFRATIKNSIITTESSDQNVNSWKF